MATESVHSCCGDEQQQATHAPQSFVVCTCAAERRAPAPRFDNTCIYPPLQPPTPIPLRSQPPACGVCNIGIFSVENGPLRAATCHIHIFVTLRGAAITTRPGRRAGCAEQGTCCSGCGPDQGAHLCLFKTNVHTVLSRSLIRQAPPLVLLFFFFARIPHSAAINRHARGHMRQEGAISGCTRRDGSVFPCFACQFRLAHA